MSLPPVLKKCPICSQECRWEDASKDGSPYRRQMYKQHPCQVFLCYNPLVSDPLHYYSHTVKVSDPAYIVVQEFSVDLGNKPVLFKNDYEEEKSYIRITKDGNPLEVPLVIIPDFPTLSSLKKKIRTAITFT